MFAILVKILFSICLILVYMETIWTSFSPGPPIQPKLVQSPQQAHTGTILWVWSEASLLNMFVKDSVLDDSRERSSGCRPNLMVWRGPLSKIWTTFYLGPPLET
jgi:hypothetical protein